MRLDWIFLPRENPCAKFYIIIFITIIAIMIMILIMIIIMVIVMVTITITIMIMIMIIMMINHDFVSSFFPRVSQHALALSSDWFIGLRPSVMTQIHCI